jgi:hypothetical protein
MKKFFTFIAMAVFAMGTMTANWQPSDTEAIRLDAEGTSGQSGMKTLRTDDGKIIHSWLRGERVDGVFGYRLHFQVFDANGNAQFGDEGVIVTDKPTATWTSDYGFDLAPNGDILFAYYDVRNDPDNQEFNEAYIYRYNQQGQPVWDADGILFPVQPLSDHALSVENLSPKICVSGDNIFVAVNHTEYFMEKANEDNWTPSPWFPNQQMPDSVLVNKGLWQVLRINDDGSFPEQDAMMIDATILCMNAAPAGDMYLVYNNKEGGLDGQLVNAELTNTWSNIVTLEDRPLTHGGFFPTPLTAVNEDDVLMLSYEVPTDFYGYQVVNYLSPDGLSAREAVSLNGTIDGDAGSAAMGVKENRAFVAWECAYSSSEYQMLVNVVDDDDNYFWTGDNTYGVSLEMTSDWGFTPVKVIPVTDGWVVLYGNSTSWNGANFMVVKVDEFGMEMWRKQICEENFKSSGFSVTYDDKNAYIFFTQEAQYDDNWNEIPGSAGMFVMCVDITGKSSSINEVSTDDIVKTEIYTIDGRRVNQLEDGVNIIRKTDANGHVTTSKVLH